MKMLVTEIYPDATCGHLVLHNLNTHTAAAALYETFAPDEA